VCACRRLFEAALEKKEKKLFCARTAAEANKHDFFKKEKLKSFFLVLITY
jgi:hypothetical protein